MGKIKDVLNSISKDEKNISPTGSKGAFDSRSARRPSKASSKEAVESVVASSPPAITDPVQENNRRLSIKTDVPVSVVDRKPSLTPFPR